VWNRKESRIEAYLESTIPQRVFIAALDMDVSLAPGERIHTEISYKYTDEMIRAILQESGFKLEYSWRDRQKWFGVHLARA